MLIDATVHGDMPSVEQCIGACLLLDAGSVQVCSAHSLSDFVFAILRTARRYSLSPPTRADDIGVDSHC